MELKSRVGKMELYYPNRSAITRVLVFVSFLVYALFAFGGSLLTFIIVLQAVSIPTPQHLALLIFPAALLTAIVYWGSGVLDLLTSHFRVSTSEGRLYFEYIGHPFSKRKEIDLAQVTNIGIAGHPRLGIWVALRTKKRSYHLGHLLAPSDAARIVETIRKAKDS